jgi:hypothetical protein
MLKYIFIGIYSAKKHNDVPTVGFEWGKVHNENLCDLYSSPSLIRMIKSTRMKWAEHVARMGEERNV